MVETERARVVDLIAGHEDALIDRVLAYAKERRYVKYTSTLREAWRISIQQLSQTITDTFADTDRELELDPDEDYATDPIAQFGILEARRHRERGVSLSMFLGLFKYYRQAYHDLISESDLGGATRQHALHCLSRIFDRIEIGLATGWANLSEARRLADLQSTNRRLTNEKNQYLTIIESLATPILFLDPSLNIVFVNHSANQLFSLSGVPGSFYYRQKAFDLTLPPALRMEVELFQQSSERQAVFEYEHNATERALAFQVYIKRMLDVSDKFSGTAVILNDITALKSAEKALEEREERYRVITESMSDYVYGMRVAADGELITEWVAGAFEAITGFTLDEIRRKRGGYLSLIDTCDANRYPLGQAEENQTRSSTVEYRIRNANGEVVWLRDHVKLLTGRGDQATRILGAVQDITQHKRAEAEIKTLKGILPICANCKKIRDDTGYWQLVEEYIRDHSEAVFSHGLCPDCIGALYSGVARSGCGRDASPRSHGRGRI